MKTEGQRRRHWLFILHEMNFVPRELSHRSSGTKIIIIKKRKQTGNSSVSVSDFREFSLAINIELTRKNNFVYWFHWEL